VIECKRNDITPDSRLTLKTWAFFFVTKTPERSNQVQIQAPQPPHSELGATPTVHVRETSARRKTPVQPDREGDLVFACHNPFWLEAGGELQPVTIRYAMYGELNREASNAVLVCHALSGSARVADWWPEILGDSGLWNLDRTCVIGTNVIGSCYGSTGPSSIDPRTGNPCGPDFPLVTIRDMVRAQACALEHLGIRRLQAVIGGSLGGMQAVQWCIDFSDRVELAIAIGTAPLSAMALALNHIQRQAIQLDPAWLGGCYASQPRAGLGIARAIATCSYKCAELFDQRCGRARNRNRSTGEWEDPFRSLEERFDVAGYLDHQADKFNSRFDANSYLVLSKAMDTFDPAHVYASEVEAFGRIQCPVILVGISSDWLFPAASVRSWGARMARAGVRCQYAELSSGHGHDAFLTETRQLAGLLREYLPVAHSRQISSPVEADS